MTVFRQENLEEHYETGEDLGRWVRAGGGNPLARGARAGAAPAAWECPSVPLSPPSPELPFHPLSRARSRGKGVGFLSYGVFEVFETGVRGCWAWAMPGWRLRSPVATPGSCPWPFLPPGGRRGGCETASVGAVSPAGDWERAGSAGQKFALCW